MNLIYQCFYLGHMSNIYRGKENIKKYKDVVKVNTKKVMEA
uniref:Uncharacterized protein n=1 Tax=Lophocladia kuetzingii TaxID=675577 RepID=A0A1Z1MPH8_9FLOR|nr:hypothetical protein [Lophocladia kuetzingii]ARW67685.1 hypothetical protein [Lophocladia kuetzingii]